MRDLLGGKGAGVAEMTRILGPDMVPAGFTITTEACVAYMRGGRRGRRACEEQVSAALVGARGASRQAARRRGGSAARLGALGRARVDAGDDGHRPQPGPERRVGRRPGRHAPRNERFAWDCYRRLVQMFGNVVPRDPGRALRGRDRARQARARRDPRHGARRRSAARADRELQVVLRLPHRPTAAADRGDPGRVRLVDGRAGRPVPPHQPAPGRLGDRRQRAADGVRQQGRDVVLRGGLQPRRGHRCARRRRATSCRAPRARTSSPASARRATSPSCAIGCRRPPIS